MAQYRGRFTNESDRPIPGACVYVHDITGAAASITDINDRPITGPLVTDENGDFAYCAADDIYRHCIWLGQSLVRVEAPIVVGDVSSSSSTDQDNAVIQTSKILAAAASGAMLGGSSQGGQSSLARDIGTDFRRRPVSILDYYLPEIDAADFSPAIGRAYENGVSHLYLPPRPGGYDFASGVAREIERDFVFDANGQAMNFALAGKIRLSGKVVASNRTLTSNASRYARQVTLDSGADIQRGDLLLIETTITPLADWKDTKQDIVRVARVLSATVELDDALNFGYSMRDSGLSVKVYRPRRFTLIRPVIRLEQDDANALPTTSFELEGLDGVTIGQASVHGNRPFSRVDNVYRYGIYIYRCLNILIDAPDYEALSYPIGVYASRHIKEQNAVARYCHHAHADLGYFSSDYLLTGLTSRDCYQGLSTHPSFRCSVLKADVRGDTGLSNWRVFGGSWNSVFVETTVDDTAELPQFQNLVPVAGYEYLNADADIVFDTVEVIAPNRVAKPALAVAYGRKASFTRVKTSFLESSMAARNNLQLLEIGPGCDFGGKRTPTLEGIRNTVSFAGIESVLDAELIGSVYHIDPRGQMMPHKGGRLACHGRIGDFGRPNVPINFRIHTNVFSDVEQVDNCIILLKLIIEARRSNGIALGTVTDTFRWSFKASANSNAVLPVTPTTSNIVGGRRTTTLSLSSPTYAGVTQIGVNGDHYVGATARVASGSANPAYAIRYELLIQRIA